MSEAPGEGPDGGSSADGPPLRWVPVAVSLGLFVLTAAVAGLAATRNVRLVFTATLPALLALTAVWYARRTGQETETAEQMRVVLEWLVTGIGTMALIGAWFGFAGWFLGVTPPPSVALVTIVAAGGLLGLLIGQYSVRAQVTVADATQARLEREYAEQRQERIALLNRILRHHMRNAVNVISASADQARRHADEGADRHLDTIRDRATEINHTVEVFQEVAETLAETDRLEPRDLGTTVRREVGRAREQYPGAEFRVDGVPETVSVRANDLLGRIVHSQLENAVQHNDSETPVVEVSVAVEDDRALLRVADNGPGIPDDEKDLVFEAGDRGVTTEGDGLELFLTRSVLDRYGGEIRIRDNEPRGAVFETAFPVADGAPVGPDPVGGAVRT